jgi:hypothetical protein
MYLSANALSLLCCISNVCFLLARYVSLLWWAPNVYFLLLCTSNGSVCLSVKILTFLHIADLLQFVLQEFLTLSSQYSTIKLLNFVRSFKERGKILRHEQRVKSSVRNAGRAPFSTSGNSTSLGQDNFTRVGNAQQRVNDGGRCFNREERISSSRSCVHRCDISAGRVSISRHTCKICSLSSKDIL